MKNILLLMGIALLSLVAAIHAAAALPMIQFRLVVDNPTADSEPMTNVGAGLNPLKQPEVLNVEKTMLLDQTAVKSATAIVHDQLGSFARESWFVKSAATTWHDQFSPDKHSIDRRRRKTIGRSDA